MNRLSSRLRTDAMAFHDTAWNSSMLHSGLREPKAKAAFDFPLHASQLGWGGGASPLVLRILFALNTMPCMFSRKVNIHQICLENITSSSAAEHNYNIVYFCGAEVSLIKTSLIESFLFYSWAHINCKNCLKVFICHPKALRHLEDFTVCPCTDPCRRSPTGMPTATFLHF